MKWLNRVMCALMKLTLGTDMLGNGSSSDVVLVTARVKQLEMQSGKVLEKEPCQLKRKGHSSNC